MKRDKMKTTTVAHGYDTQETLSKLWNLLSRRVVTRRNWSLWPQSIFAKAQKQAKSLIAVATSYAEGNGL
jgi:hypothetical protein